jgi:hypothetical protein
MIGIGFSSNLRYNIKAYFERLFLDNGMYADAVIGEYDYAGRQSSVLRKNGRFFESVANGWVHEEDVTVPSGYTSPIVVSGVWINSVFHANDSSPYYPKPDYERGRFTFLGTIPAASATVEANFTFKEVTVDFTDSETFNIIESQYLHNPDYWSQQTFPSGVERLLPVVVIDMQTRGHMPRQIGGGKILGDRADFWVMGAKDWERDALLDIIFDEARATITAADYNDAPEVLTFYGEKASTYQSHTDLGLNYPWGRIYIDKMAIRGRDLVGHMYRGKLEGIFTVYQNS